MKKLFIYYGFVVSSIMTLTGFLGASNYSQLVSASLFFPVFVYFGTLIFPERKRALVVPQRAVAPKKVRSSKKPTVLKKIDEKSDTPLLDKDRRMFLKLIGTGGMSVLLLSLFGAKSAQAAFFGSVPGPGIVGVKDTSGTAIDPSKHHPTDGYRISRLDDSVPAYYGFTNKDGEWFIMKEDASGNYTYATGSTDFTDNWTGKGDLSYGEFFDKF